VPAAPPPGCPSTGSTGSLLQNLRSSIHSKVARLADGHRPESGVVIGSDLLGDSPSLLVIENGRDDGVP
jgi:hypothetical protein